LGGDSDATVARPQESARLVSVNTSAKGRRLQTLAKHALEARGYRVEVARNVVRWIPTKARTALGRLDAPSHPISTHHDLFTLWDLLWCREDGVLGLAQVTTLENLSHRRKKILADGFPLTPQCWILAYVGGRGAHFRLYRPPFEAWEETVR